MNGWFWETLFWLCAGLTLYTYGGYYLILSTLSRVTVFRTECDEGYTPLVSVIIAARNEGTTICKRIQNLLGLNYPADRLEVIVGSDGSTDDTVEAASACGDGKARVLDFKVNRGRAMTHNDCVRAAAGEILVFTDAETVFETDFLRKVCRYYRDPRVGAVTGGLSFLSREDGSGSAESFYFRYEKKLRKLESGLGLLASGSGACFSIRRNLYRELKPREDVDFILPLECISSGYRVIMEMAAHAYDFPSSNLKGVVRSRIRMTSQFQSGFWKGYGPRFMLSHPLQSWALLSRKAMRQVVGFFMLGALVSNAVLLGGGGIYMFAMLLQAVFYGLALFSSLLSLAGITVRGPLTWPLVFVTAHLGMALGVLAGLFGKTPSSYEPDKA